MDAPYMAASSMAEQVKEVLVWDTRLGAGAAVVEWLRGGVGGLPAVLSCALLMAVRKASPGFLCSTLQTQGSPDGYVL